MSEQSPPKDPRDRENSGGEEPQTRDRELRVRRQHLETLARFLAAHAATEDAERYRLLLAGEAGPALRSVCEYALAKHGYHLDTTRLFDLVSALAAMDAPEWAAEHETEFKKWIHIRVARAIEILLDQDERDEANGVELGPDPEPRFLVVEACWGLPLTVARKAAIVLNRHEAIGRIAAYRMFVQGVSEPYVIKKERVDPHRLRASLRALLVKMRNFLEEDRP